MEEPVVVSCPWCGESFDTFYDWSAGNQSYTEDCQICCRPIVLRFYSQADQVQVSAERE